MSAGLFGLAIPPWAKPAGIIVGIILLTGGIWLHGDFHGQHVVQVKWDADSAKRDAAAAKQALASAAKDAEIIAQREATAKANKEKLNDYQKRVAAIVADRDSLARRMHDYEVRLRTLSEGRTEDTSGPGAAGPSTEPEAPRTVDVAFDAYDKACRSDAAQLNALIAQIKGQLPKTTSE